MAMKSKLMALLITVFIQVCFAGLFFIGGLMDPLIAVWLVAIYFFIGGSYFIYKNILN